MAKQTPPTVEFDDSTPPTEETAQEATGADQATTPAADPGSAQDGQNPPDGEASPTEEVPADIAYALQKRDEAKAAHDAWVAERIADGWAWGATFDEVSRTDPKLVHYDLMLAQANESPEA